MQPINKEFILTGPVTINNVTPDYNSNNFFNEFYRGVEFIINVTAITGVGANLNLKAQGFDPFTSAYWFTTAGINLTATGIFTLRYYPGIGAAVAPNQNFSTAFPRTYRMNGVVTGTPPFSTTFSISGCYQL